MNIDYLVWLQQWYAQQCDGDWEHTYGIEILSLDNPGWSVRINLDETDLAEKSFERHEIHKGELDWLRCWVGEGELHRQHSERMFQAFCGPENLVEVLRKFHDWVNQCPAGPGETHP